MQAQLRHVADLGETHADAGHPVARFEPRDVLTGRDHLTDALVARPGRPIDAVLEHVHVPGADAAGEPADLNFVSFRIGNGRIADLDTALGKVANRSTLHVVQPQTATFVGDAYGWPSNGSSRGERLSPLASESPGPPSVEVCPGVRPRNCT